VIKSEPLKKSWEISKKKSKSSIKNS